MSIDVSKIKSGLYLGSQAAESGPVESLKSLGISSVLQLGTGPTMQPSHADLTYKCICVEDRDGEDLVRMLIDSNALDFIDHGISMGSILVHCQLGMSRSATAVLAFLMTRDKMTFTAALGYLMQRRHFVQPNMGFCNQLKGLENCHNDLRKYDGPADFLRSDDEWLCFLDRARSAAGL